MPTGVYLRVKPIHRKGKSLSKEHKKRLSEEHKKKIGAFNKGKTFSDETRKKLSIANKGQKRSKQTRLKMSLSHKGILRPDLQGNKAYNWKGGKHVNMEGYVVVLCRDHPHSKKGYVLEHRLMMEQKIRRYLKPEEIVHHINGLKTDNRLKNLQLLKNRSQHMKIHRAEQLARQNEGGKK